MKIDFSPKQKEVWRNTINRHHRWNISYGAVRSGKTYLDYFKIPYRIRNAGHDGLILLLGNTKGTLERNILDPLRELWTPLLVGHIGSNNKVQLFGRECYALGADKINRSASCRAPAWCIVTAMRSRRGMKMSLTCLSPGSINLARASTGLVTRTTRTTGSGSSWTATRMSTVWDSLSMTTLFDAVLRGEP
jgi:hypothetical protein